jgi:AcrR family transcriptional regulator
MEKNSPLLNSDPGLGADAEGDDGVSPSARMRRAEQRRNQTLDAANTIFQRHGFHRASMAQVAAEAGMSVGQIYRYFENKEEVIAAISERDLEHSMRDMQAMLQDPAGVPAALLAGVGQGVAKMLDRPSAALFLEVMAEAVRNPKVAESVRLQHGATLACVGALVARGQGPNARYTPAQAMDLMSLVFTGLRIRAIQDPDARVDELAETVRAFVRDLVGAD